jgi:hypothetical protein
VQGVWQSDLCRLNVKDGHRSGRSSTSADPVQNIDAGSQTCEYCSIGIKVSSFLRHHLGHCAWRSRLQESLLQVSSLSSDWRTQIKHTWYLPWCFFNVTKSMVKHFYDNCYRRWDLALPLRVHHREQGWLDDLKASSISSQKEVQDSTVSRESDGRYFVGWLCTGTCGRHGAINLHWNMRTLRYHKPAMAHTDITVP